MSSMLTFGFCANTAEFNDSPSPEEIEMTITVFTKPHCPQCDATKRQFTKLGVNFETVDLSKSPEALDQLRNAGYRQAPVVIAPDTSWSGYRPDLIAQIADKLGTSSETAKEA